MKSHNLINTTIHVYVAVGIILGGTLWFYDYIQANTSKNRIINPHPNHASPKSESGLYRLQISNRSTDISIGSILASSVNPNEFSLSQTQRSDLANHADITLDYPVELLIGSGTITGMTGFTTHVLDTIAVDALKISITPTMLDISIQPDEMMTVPITISNTGNLPLDWSIMEAPGLLNVKSAPPVPRSPGITQQVELTLEGNSTDSKVASVGEVLNSAFSLWLDDGSDERNVGVNSDDADYQFIWLNRFSPNPLAFPFNLKQIQVFFNTGTDVKAGDTIDLVVYQDADSDPSNGATWLATYNVAVKYVDGINWSVYDLPVPLLITGPGDVLIAVINRYAVNGVSQKTYPASLDQNSSQHRSWLGYWGGDPPNPALLPPTTFYNVDTYFPGNWMIRGSGETITNFPWLSEDPIVGTITPGMSVVVDVLFDATGLVLGEYSATLWVSSNDPGTPSIDIPVTMTLVDRNIYLSIIMK